MLSVVGSVGCPWGHGRDRCRWCEVGLVSVSVRPERLSATGTTRDTGHHSRLVPRSCCWPPRHAALAPTALAAASRSVGSSPCPGLGGVHHGVVRLSTVPAGAGVRAVVNDPQRRPGGRFHGTGLARRSPSRGSVTCDSPDIARACWGCVRVVTTGPRRVVTTLSVGAAGCGRAPPGLQQGLMSAVARVSPPCWGREHTLASRSGWGRSRRQGRPRTRISRPCGRRFVGDQAGWGTRRSGQGDA